MKRLTLHAETCLSHKPFAQVLSDYRRLEPGQADTWNPLFDDNELFQRLAIFRELTLALRQIKADLSKFKILDIGCGTGRSCRMYLDLGFMPGQITGIDIRDGAVALAEKTHPAIKIILYDGTRMPLPDNHFNWVSLCLVMSSVRSHEDRHLLSQEIYRIIAPGSHLFYWDLQCANNFAGADPLIAEQLFPQLVPVLSRKVSLYGSFEDIIMPGRAKSVLKTLLRRYLKKPSHYAVLLTKPSM